MASAISAVVSAQQQHTSLAAVATSPNSLSATVRGPEHRAIGRLISLVGDVVARLETPAGEPLGGLVGECNAALEVCLELQRDVGDRDELVTTARDDLKRLARLLTVVDRADVPFVMRQIRRVLGRFDTCGAHAGR
jgi:hypothetical protein